MLSEEQEHTYEKAMDQALRFLAPRFLSSYELRQKISTLKIKCVYGA